jgi:hypothetical protein
MRPLCRVESAEDRRVRIVALTPRGKDLIGAEALRPEVRPQFDLLSAVCASKGLFINPVGGLESMLVEYGIEPTTDKKGWIVQALQLLPGLTVDDKKHPWKFLIAIHAYLRLHGRN